MADGPPSDAEKNDGEAGDEHCHGGECSKITKKIGHFGFLSLYVFSLFYFCSCVNQFSTGTRKNLPAAGICECAGQTQGMTEREAFRGFISRLPAGRYFLLISPMERVQTGCMLSRRALWSPPRMEET
ncbi:hypothetical protein [Shinella zoogloeoides]|uniref:hypothetical protein n=1 Tax=Shinella zoogloeoides TaxID=352475 RepID=UPI0028AB0DD9|nr:hypothetical protein [Shinella zoogloeoides]